MQIFYFSKFFPLNTILGNIFVSFCTFCTLFLFLFAFLGQQMFRLKRSQQLVAVKNLIDTDDVQNRHKTIKLLTDAMQKVVIDSRNQLFKLGFEPGMEFPENIEIREGKKTDIDELLVRHLDVGRLLVKQYYNWFTALNQSDVD